ncbi:MAG: hypothetical protein JNM66_24565 [Bryobacterales bacterium]|nr:hypothetical protein [Bryobacterales bacterium]
MRENQRFLFWLPAVAMMLGWGLRGFIGGGPFGAMIPGAMVALALCLLFPRRDVAMLCAFAAVGVGIGGEMTYGQTVGFSVQAETFWFGIIGLALKGGIWGALAGAVIAMGFTPRPALVAGGVAVMAAATQFGWKVINEPKLIYFSNRLDKPRPEIWAGFLLAAIALVGYLGWRGRLQPALRFAVVGFIGGFIGFGGGGAIQGLGRIFTPELKLHWWKYMEFFFGLCFGWALAWAWVRSEVPAGEEPAAAPPLWLDMLTGAALTGALLWVSWNFPSRFAYLLAGSVVLLLLTRLRWAAKHVAYTTTFTAFALDLARYWSREYKWGPEAPAYAAAIAASIVFAWFVIQWHADTLRMLELLTWTAVMDAVIKFAINPQGVIAVVDHVCIGFVLMAAAVSWMARSTVETSSCDSVLPSSSPGSAVSTPSH